MHKITSVNAPTRSISSSVRGIVETLKASRSDSGLHSTSGPLAEPVSPPSAQRTMLKPLVFHPLIHRALWGGRELKAVLGKEIGVVEDAAESWEVCDLPGNQTRVAEGDLNGHPLRFLMENFRTELLGSQSHFEQFPLLIKFLDAQEQLSVQVHPKQPTLHADGTMRTGKAEAWVVLSVQDGSEMALGLKEGVTTEDLAEAIRTNNFSDCLHIYRPTVGDCVYLEPGTVHSLGGGILLAEIQQPCDITYRLYDWGRLDSKGQPRQLHVEQGLASANIDHGPVLPIAPQQNTAWSENGETLVISPFFEIYRHTGPDQLQLPQDDRMHVLIIIEGTVSADDQVWSKGTTVVIPAHRDEFTATIHPGSILIQSCVPFAAAE